MIYRFSGSDGAFPDTELTFDRNGNMFGTSPHGGTADQGTVFELARNGNGWNESSVLYDFADFKPPGNQPVGGVILDSAGNIYGTTLTGGDPLCQCGVVLSFRLRLEAGPIACYTRLPGP